MKVKVLTKAGLFKCGHEIVHCDRIRFQIKEKQFTGYVGEGAEEGVSAYISNAIGYVAFTEEG